MSHSVAIPSLRRLAGGAFVALASVGVPRDADAQRPTVHHLEATPTTVAYG